MIYSYSYTLDALRRVASRWPHHRDPAVLLGWTPLYRYGAAHLHHFRSKGLMDAGGPRGCIVGELFSDLKIAVRPDDNEVSALMVATETKLFSRAAVILLDDCQKLSARGLTWSDVILQAHEMNTQEAEDDKANVTKS